MHAVTITRASEESFHMLRLFNRCHDFVYAYGIEVWQLTVFSDSKQEAVEWGLFISSNVQFVVHVII